MKKALTIAGSDSGGCAGIQADIKAMSSCGVFAMSVITAVTAQNTQTVTHIEELSEESIIAQIRAVYDDMAPDAVKTGMLFSAGIIDAVADTLKEVNNVPLVVDPVMCSASGAKLIKDDAIDTMINKLFPIATLVTPNRMEAELLTGIKIESDEDIEMVCKKIYGMGVKNVLLKGGHFDSDEACDYLYDGSDIYEAVAPKINTNNLHGTGCTFASAITAFLAQGMNLEESVGKAKEYITYAIMAGAHLQIGSGSGPVNHFYNYVKDQQSGGGCCGGGGGHGRHKQDGGCGCGH